MGSAALHTEVSAAALSSYSAKQGIIAKDAEALPTFFEDCRNAFQIEYSDRPRKRAKLENTDLLEITPSCLGSRVTIARLEIHLQLPSSDSFRRNAPDTLLEDDIEVGLVDTCSQYSPQLSLSLVGHVGYKKSPTLEIKTTASISPPTANLLSRIVTLERRSRRNAKTGVCQSVCRLHRSTGPSGPVYMLECTITWLDGASAFGPAAIEKDWDVLSQFYPESQDIQRFSWTPQQFYSSVHSPPVDAYVPESVQRKVLETELYPFQTRAVAWMLDRENLPHDARQSRFSYTPVKDAYGQPCFVSHLEGVICYASHFNALEEPKGGILAEEMGLGKTCELIALICLNKRDFHPLDTGQSKLAQNLTASRATLIVTPQTILQQWKDELARHAPGLSVLHYTGISNTASSKTDGQSVLQDLAQRDVVITTYNVLAKEVYFAVDPPDRSMRRRERKYTRPRSPLVQMHWWRVCLDEAQMVESGVSAAAQVASLLPRVNAWAVSGTPLKKDVQDLYGLLVFLKYQPFCDLTATWRRLIKQYGDMFKTLFGRITLRHTKDQVRQELRLPPQRRVVLTLPFTQVEEQNYKTLFETMCEECGCKLDGSPRTADWDPKSSVLLQKMRAWLCRLRQTCLHPQVGGRNRKALGRGQGPLRTVSEVLEVMIDQNETSIRTESRSAITTQLLRGHIIGNARDDENRAEKALEIYKSALESSAAIVAECRADVANSGVAGDNIDDVDEDSEEEMTPEQASRGRCRAALNSALQLQHACAFFVGTAYFQMKANPKVTEPDSARFQELEQQEIMYYDIAKQVRKELLREHAAKAEKLMRTIRKGEEDVVLECSKLATMESPGGVENLKIIYKARDLAKILDAQAKLIEEWKTKATELLLKPLLDEDEDGLETTGDEYEDSTKLQDTLNAYLDALRAVIADRSTCITGQSVPLVDQEMNSLAVLARDGLGHAPELLLTLLKERNSLKQKPDGLLSLRGLAHEARSIETALEWRDGNARAGAELHIIKAQGKQLANITSDETKVLAKLEKVNELLLSTMNQRLEFYRQLQQISDTVAPHKDDYDDTLDVIALEAATRRQEQQTNSLAALKTKNRFLLHLREESTSSQETQRICVICQSSFEQGVLTVCGHQYCKECIQLWWSAHRTCPCCKRRLTLADFHQITYKPREIQAQEEKSEPSSPGQSSAKSVTPASLYVGIGSETLAQINSIDLNGSFGTKIDTLARHILWIREHDPGAKAIVFSQFREFLDVLGTAFKQFGIGFSRMGKPGAVDRFKNDASIECFLLDAKTDSSGLNLVNAQYVFLAEPLINTAIELQAISRVHRIGQLSPTTVYMYLIGDTVEEDVYDISVTRRLAHMQKRQRRSESTTPELGEAAIDAANSIELQQAPVSKLLVQGQGGGEVVPEDDLWSCLFGRAAKGQKKAGVSAKLEAEVGRHLRLEAAESRRAEE